MTSYTELFADKFLGKITKFAGSNLAGSNREELRKVFQIAADNRDNCEAPKV